MKGSKTAQFCLQHMKEGLVKNKRRGHPSCNKQPSFGMKGSKTAQFCLQHMKEGLVNVKNKRRGHPSCNRRSSYGLKGSKTAEFCAGHAKESMVNIMSKDVFTLIATSIPGTAWEAARRRIFACNMRKTAW